MNIIIEKIMKKYRVHLSQQVENTPMDVYVVTAENRKAAFSEAMSIYYAAYEELIDCGRMRVMPLDFIEELMPTPCQ